MGHHFRNERGLVDWKKMKEEAQKIINFLEVDVDIDAQVGSLGVAKKQVVEIAKALSLNAQVLIMDEPTAALAKKEIETLFRIIRFRRSSRDVREGNHRFSCPCNRKPEIQFRSDQSGEP